VAKDHLKPFGNSPEVIESRAAFGWHFATKIHFLKEKLFSRDSDPSSTSW